MFSCNLSGAASFEFARRATVRSSTLCQWCRHDPIPINNATNNNANKSKLRFPRTVLSEGIT